MKNIEKLQKDGKECPTTGEKRQKYLKTVKLLKNQEKRKKVFKTVKNVKKLGENRQKYRKNV